MTNQQTATNETLVETLWACRQFIVDHIHSGDEFAIILRIDKELAREVSMMEGEDGWGTPAPPDETNQYNPYCNGWVQSL